MVHRHLTGDFLLLRACDAQQLAFAAEVARYAPPPASAPRAAFVVGILAASIRAVHGLLATPNDAVIEVMANATSLAEKMRELRDRHSIDAPSALLGRKTKNPSWYQLARPELARHTLAKIYIGCAFLHAFHQKKPLPKAFSDHLEDILQEEDLNAKGIDALLAGEQPTPLVGEAWLNRLLKNWRMVLKHYSSTPPPPLTPDQRASSQILSAALNSTTGTRAGSSSHRQLSYSQLQQAIASTHRALEVSSLKGALAVISLVSPFSVDVAAMLPLRRLNQVVATSAFIDPALGTLNIDWGLAINEPGEPRLACTPSSYTLVTPLPDVLVKTLRDRVVMFPDATRLAHLYPEDSIPSSSDPVYPSDAEIIPSWARLQISGGNFLRDRGMNTLLAAMCSAMLALVPRSKFHYSTVLFDEYLASLSEAYRLFGWGKPVSLIEPQMAFGCRTTPPTEILQLHDTALCASVAALYPGPNGGFDRLVEHHNAYTCLIGWRLSVLLALRAASRVEISADIDEKNDRWIDVHDKTTRADRGRQPVPLCNFARDCISDYRSHCAALARRLKRLGGPTTELELRCAAIAAGKNCRLLTYSTPDGRVRPLASIRFTTSTNLSYSLPPDVGRKVSENALRYEGLPSSLIDAFLRHFMVGQQQLSSTSHSALAADCARSAQAMDRVGKRLFQTEVYGLSKD